jgi:hypothetical protein
MQFVEAIKLISSLPGSSGQLKNQGHCVPCPLHNILLSFLTHYCFLSVWQWGCCGFPRMTSGLDPRVWCDLLVFLSPIMQLTSLPVKVVGFLALVMPLKLLNFGIFPTVDSFPCFGLSFHFLNAAFQSMFLILTRCVLPFFKFYRSCFWCHMQEVFAKQKVIKIF